MLRKIILGAVFFIGAAPLNGMIKQEIVKILKYGKLLPQGNNLFYNKTKFNTPQTRNYTTSQDTKKNIATNTFFSNTDLTKGSWQPIDKNQSIFRFKAHIYNPTKQELPLGDLIDRNLKKFVEPSILETRIPSNTSLDLTFFAKQDSFYFWVVTEGPKAFGYPHVVNQIGGLNILDQSTKTQKLLIELLFIISQQNDCLPFVIQCNEDVSKFLETLASTKHDEINVFISARENREIQLELRRVEKDKPDIRY